MWLKIFYDNSDIPEWWSKEPSKVSVELDFSKIAPISDNQKSFRISPIFPLVQNELRSIDNNTIHFYSFSNAYRVLGRIQLLGSKELQECVFFSIGLSSVILISNNENIIQQFIETSLYDSLSTEKWIIENSIIKTISYDFKKSENGSQLSLNIEDYSKLPLAERSVIDEFKISAHFLVLKTQTHMVSELDKINRLVSEINDLIIELIYLEDISTVIPQGLKEYSMLDFQDGRLRNMIKHQNLDRIIQVNSALSYVSTQAFSGATPILERRSLVRRNSLLGIGSAILALNNIARFIESCFSKVAFEDVIIKGMSISSPLQGLDVLHNYNSTTWYDSSVSKFSHFIPKNNSYFKLPYFNGRLGFRESEYSIAAAIQSLTSGASLEWSLMTITHEMLHGHVRDLLTFIFFGDESQKEEDKRKLFYDKFIRKVHKKVVKETLIDSIRCILFTYCCLSITHGSLTSIREFDPAKVEIEVPEQNELWETLEIENRNINEIMVHILDLHYFYASRVSVYIPLIWCSWVAVPYISGDIRQYILRSILTICSKTDGSVFTRFKQSIGRLKELLIKYQANKLNHPIILEVLDILDNTDLLMLKYFPAFKSSIIIVDMIGEIFISEAVRASIFNDEFAKFEDDDEVEDSFEKIFKYDLSDGFNDEIIKSPILYLLDKMIKQLNSTISTDDLEKETSLQLIALNSN
ncbi:hypothetical protein [Pedobacter agri]|uniref:hypothetical protein n=1 Tax=Pedobacter agri TaxID=454586 RepID=UPI00292D07F7|nr:hypothetical protein [Pedobacter agri]